LVLGEDATGGRVESLTEAVMGLTAGMVQIANAIESLACAVRERADRTTSGTHFSIPMPRNISFAITTDQIRNRSKTVTRRAG
jgi:hypothetical protein